MAGTLTSYKALTFDCYGTLIDWETGIWDAMQPLLMASSGQSITRGQALEVFGAIESEQQSRTPAMLYPELLANVHAELAARFGLRTSPDMDEAFGNSIAHWPAFPDTADALRELKKHYRLVILSNVSRAGFAASNRKLGVEFDAIYTAEDIGSYKPDPRNFSYLLDHLARDFGIEAGDVLHTAQSLFHDHVPASKVGLARAWIDRQKLSAGGGWGATARVSDRPEVDFVFSTLGEMASAVTAG